MDKKSNIEKTAFDLTEDEFCKMIEQQRLSDFEALALKQFTRASSEPDLCNDFKSKLWEYIPLIFLLAVIFLDTIVSNMYGGMEWYVAIPIALLSFLGFLILIKPTKQHN